MEEQILINNGSLPKDSTEMPPEESYIVINELKEKLKEIFVKWFDGDLYPHVREEVWQFIEENTVPQEKHNALLIKDANLLKENRELKQQISELRKGIAEYNCKLADERKRVINTFTKELNFLGIKYYDPISEHETIVIEANLIEQIIQQLEKE